MPGEIDLRAAPSWSGRRSPDHLRGFIASLDLGGVRAQANSDYTLRWATAHVTMDTSRHAGHADLLLREPLDGERGP
ncbi:mycothiol transferase [Streptomyces sp. NPDC001617]